MKTKTKATKKPKLSNIEIKIAKLNAAYKKATPAQRRVMIARDALAEIKKGSIIPQRGTYVHLYGDDIRDDEPLQPVLLDEETRCTCCAKGALFVSCVRLSNRFNGSPALTGSGAINELVEWPEKNYHDIEGAFELWESTDDFNPTYKWVNKWRKKYLKSDDRLVAILKNIIRNKGTFRKHDV